MPRPSFDTFKDAEGRIDWKAYKEAEIANGDICHECHGFILFGGKGYPESCRDCRKLNEDKGEVEHKHSIRCPKCRQTINPFDFETVNIDEALRDESVDIYCTHCDTRFHVGVRVEYFFTSPPILEEGEEPDEDDAA